MKIIMNRNEYEAARLKTIEALTGIDATPLGEEGVKAFLQMQMACQMFTWEQLQQVTIAESHKLAEKGNKKIFFLVTEDEVGFELNPEMIADFINILDGTFLAKVSNAYIGFTAAIMSMSDEVMKKRHEEFLEKWDGKKSAEAKKPDLKLVTE